MRQKIPRTWGVFPLRALERPFWRREIRRLRRIERRRLLKEALGAMARRAKLAA